MKCKFLFESIIYFPNRFLKATCAFLLTTTIISTTLNASEREKGRRTCVS